MQNIIYIRYRKMQVYRENYKINNNHCEKKYVMINPKI